MAGHPFRAEESACIAEPLFKSSCEKPEDLRRFLLRLALDSHTPDEVLKQACIAIREALECACSFIESDAVFEPAPGYLSLPVMSDGVPFGALVIRDDVLESKDFKQSDLEEIAELVALAMMNARQSAALGEFESDSEDMIFHAPDAIFVLSSTGTVQMANRRFLEFLGMTQEETVGRPMPPIFDPGCVTWDVLADCIRASEVLEIEASASIGRRLVSLMPSFVSESMDGKILCILRDITAERQSHLAIRRTERSLLMGKAVEYLLHEVNNPLAALISNLSHARAAARELPPATQPSLNLHRSLSNAKDAADRIRETMSQLRAARIGKEKQVLSPVDVGHEISLALGGLEEEITRAAHVSIEREIQVKGRIRMTPLVIAETTGALVRNSLEALEGERNGSIRIVATETDRALLISVEDNGPGVPPHLTDQVFMPFFTTKPLGRSLGLGLTMADDAVKRHGGTLRLIPSKVGARFEMVIPKLTSAS